MPDCTIDLSTINYHSEIQINSDGRPELHIGDFIYELDNEPTIEVNLNIDFILNNFNTIINNYKNLSPLEKSKTKLKIAEVIKKLNNLMIKEEN